MNPTLPRPVRRARPRSAPAALLATASAIALVTTLVTTLGAATTAAPAHARTDTGDDPADPQVVQVVEDHPDGTSTTSWLLEGRDGVLTPVGPRRGRELQARQEAAEPDAAAAAVPQAHRAYVATIAGGDYGPGSLSQELGWIDQVLDFWVDQSSGAITDFRRVGAVASFALPSGTQCDAGSTLWNTARAAFPGVQFGAGDHLVVLAPASMNGVSCTFGLGSVGGGIGSGGSLSVNDVSQLRGGLAHEIGHNLGLQHAGSQSCDPIDSTSCEVSAYGGTYDVMGISPDGKPPALRSFARDWLGVSQACEVPTVSLPAGQRSTTTTYDLFPRSAPTGARGLRVTDPVTGLAYYLDWRTKLGQDSEWGGSTTYAGGKQRGVTLERVRADNTRWADLVPAARTPQGVTWSAAPGTTRSVAGGGLSFTVDSAEAGTSADDAAQLTVTLTDPARPAGSALPEQSGTLTLPSLVQEGTTVTAATTAWSAGSCFRYRWSIDGVELPADRGATLAIPPGTTGRRLTLTVTGQQSGLAPLTRTISRTIGTPEPEPVPVPVPVTTTQPPGPAAGHIVVLRAPRLVGRPVVGSILRVRARWAPDDVRVRYRWYVGSTRVAHGSKPRLRLRGAYVGQVVRVAVVARAPGTPKLKIVPKRRVRVQARD